MGRSPSARSPPYTYAIEFVGVLTGLPYGPFEYGIDLGPMLAGTVPAALPIFFVTLVVNAYLLAVLLLGDRAGRAWIRLPVVIGPAERGFASRS